jgi:6-phosphogluconolactonase
MEKPANISVFETADQLALAAAERFVECAYKTHDDFERFSVVLAGGQTPKRVYELLATERFKDRVDWAKVYLFFGDERAVPPAHPDSNYRMVYEALISQVPIPAINVHRMIGEGNATENAQFYENALQAFFAGMSWPRFDLVFLGMGEDGHTASLFPDSEALQEKAKWVTTNRSERFPHERITLTLPVLNAAAHVMFLVIGKEKAQRLKEVLNSESASEPVPAQLIQPVDGTVEWLLDSAAAPTL